MRVTLKNRITTSIIIFAIVLMSAFAAIQVQNQLHMITIFNSLRAKLTAQILKNAVQKSLNELNAQDDISKTLHGSLNSLTQSGLFDAAYVYSADGAIKASTNKIYTDKQASAAELTQIKQAIQGTTSAKGIDTYIDKATRSLTLYIPIKSNDGPFYVGRLDISLGNMQEALKQVYAPLILTVAMVAISSIFFGIILSRRVTTPISLLNTATKEIAGGDLNLKIHMDTNDELEELSDTFNLMAIELKKMRLKAENANPLTKLPGNIIIQERVEKRIAKNEKFTVIYCDLDNFKAFNDKYGIHKGDKAIELTAGIFKEAIQKNGSNDDFIGHEGGDDFILLTIPERTEKISSYITNEFDKRIRLLYANEDLGRGYIEEKARHGDEIIKFPIMTISLAGISNMIRPISSYGEVTNIAAEVKKKAKKISGSCFVIDQRKEPWPPHTPHPA
ncbi:MAG: diguanylate cyclase [Dehalococcoidia bacterium]|nr:MAG: diguanylate cyclase [Dehalococcoidia bacterium]